MLILSSVSTRGTAGLVSIVGRGSHSNLSAIRQPTPRPQKSEAAPLSTRLSRGSAGQYYYNACACPTCRVLCVCELLLHKAAHTGASQPRATNSGSQTLAIQGGWRVLRKQLCRRSCSSPTALVTCGLVLFSNPTRTTH